MYALSAGWLQLQTNEGICLWSPLLSPLLPSSLPSLPGVFLKSNKATVYILLGGGRIHTFFFLPLGFPPPQLSPDTFFSIYCNLLLVFCIVLPAVFFANRFSHFFVHFFGWYATLRMKINRWTSTYCYRAKSPSLVPPPFKTEKHVRNQSEKSRISVLERREESVMCKFCANKPSMWKCVHFLFKSKLINKKKLNTQ